MKRKITKSEAWRFNTYLNWWIFCLKGMRAMCNECPFFSEKEVVLIVNACDKAIRRVEQERIEGE